MIFIFCALYQEAAPLIRRFGMKRVSLLRSAETFSAGPDVLLTITKTGELSAASVTAAVLSKYEMTGSDYLICWGSAASVNGEKEGVFQCHKLTEMHGGRSYYPDLLIRTGLPEASVLTGSQLYRNGDLAAEGYDLYDMESAAVFHAGKMFMGPHQMFFFRFVSDAGDPDRLDPETLKELSERYIDPVAELIEALREQETEEPVLSEETEQMIRELAEQMKCTAFMANELRHILYYAVLCGKDPEQMISAVRDRLPAADKEEGKQILREIRNAAAE